MRNIVPGVQNVKCRMQNEIQDIKKITAEKEVQIFKLTADCYSA